MDADHPEEDRRVGPAISRRGERIAAHRHEGFDSSVATGAIHDWLLSVRRRLPNADGLRNHARFGGYRGGREVKPNSKRPVGDQDRKKVQTVSSAISATASRACGDISFV